MAVLCDVLEVRLSASHRRFGCAAVADGLHGDVMPLPAGVAWASGRITVITDGDKLNQLVFSSRTGCSVEHEVCTALAHAADV